MSELSIFVDESGDLGGISDYYLVTLVFHDQNDTILDRIDRYERALSRSSLPNTPFHAGPLLNGNGDYRDLPKEQRRHMLSAFRAFIQHLPIRYFCLQYRMSEFTGNQNSLAERMRRDLTVELFDHLEFFQRYDTVKIYYDNGQPIVTEVIHSALEYVLARDVIVYREATPRAYRLFQVADYICTIELTAIKFDSKEETKTDRLFFGTRRTFKKGFLSYLRNKRMN